MFILGASQQINRDKKIHTLAIGAYIIRINNQVFKLIKNMRLVSLIILF